GMLNGLLTLRGAWDKVRNDPTLKFMVVAVTAYGMSTFEGPLLSIKSFNALTHYTDWTIGHVHIGTLGWNGFLTFGILYWLVPKMWKTKLHSYNLANAHFWIGTLGIIMYAVPLYIGGLVQSLMWKEFDGDGFLVYKNFLETVVQILPMYWLRAIGGTLYIVGVFMMVYNLIKTAGAGAFQANEEAEAQSLDLKAPYKTHKNEYWHKWIERRPIQMLILSLVMILIGGIVEMVPTFMIKSNIPTIASVEPYTPLELQGRDLYVKEGCYTCHSQMIRPFRSETERYGEYSKAGEFVYDRPFQWGSKRTGPDLHRVGGKYSDSWHYQHMLDPRTMSPGSIMPSYPWLFKNKIDIASTPARIGAMMTLGVPYQYPEGQESQAISDLTAQADEVIKNLINEGTIDQAGGETLKDKQIVALIAYLQRLGTDIKK
ncbi:MAG: cytochrome-c oxidase, cbb3-type subunit II, partial [Bacteroidetes bacterium]|nr:cytochrome-c oxidase, cbb3-type subunit II [Bacteroidota bacterium]